MLKKRLPTDRLDWPTDTDWQTYTDWDRPTYCQTNKQTDLQTLTNRTTDTLTTERLTHWQTERLTRWQTKRLTHWQTERLTHWQTERPTPTNRPIYRHGQTDPDKHTDWHWQSDWHLYIFSPVARDHHFARSENVLIIFWILLLMLSLRWANCPPWIPNGWSYGDFPWAERFRRLLLSNVLSTLSFFNFRLTGRSCCLSSFSRYSSLYSYRGIPNGIGTVFWFSAFVINEYIN